MKLADASKCYGNGSGMNSAILGKKASFTLYLKDRFGHTVLPTIFEEDESNANNNTDHTETSSSSTNTTTTTTNTSTSSSNQTPSILTRKTSSSITKKVALKKSSSSSSSSSKRTIHVDAKVVFLRADKQAYIADIHEYGSHNSSSSSSMNASSTSSMHHYSRSLSSLAIEDYIPKKTEVHTTVVYNGDGSYAVSYKPMVAGEYLLTVWVNGHKVKGLDGKIVKVII